MTPEEIESAEFFVGMRGYQRAEVRAFLHAAADEQRALRERIAELEIQSGAAGRVGEVDIVDELGQHVAAIVRSARESARALVSDAERDAALVRESADAHAEAVRHEVEARRAEADRLLADALLGADRITEEALERASQEAEAVLAEGQRRRDEAVAAAEEIVARLCDAVSGASVALLALRADEDDGAVLGPGSADTQTEAAS